MGKYDATISIVTYNNEKVIKTLLDSILDKTKGIDYHVYIVDNCSSDGTSEIVKAKMEESARITFIENEDNVGFGRAHNQILPLMDSRYHVYINPDVTLDNDAISDIAMYMDQNPDIGLITPKVLYPDGRIQILPKKNPKLIYLFARRSAWKSLRKYKDIFEMSDMDENKAFDIEFSTGCFIFARTDIIKKIGGFDEDFFLYLEDADLSRRVSEHARVLYNPDFYVYHDWQRGSKKSMKLLLIHLESIYIYFKKWGFKN